MRTAVLLNTYNSPEVLRKTLIGLMAQSERNFETIIVDDGSRPETRELLERPEFASLELKHVWQPDNGWRRPRVMNAAIAQCEADYIIFVDQDTIPRRDFVETHLHLSRRGTYLSGSRVAIAQDVHPQFTDDDIRSGRVFDLEFLAARDPRVLKKKWRLQAGRWAPLMNLVTYRYATLMGCNASMWREDLLAINGFDESFGYGSDDRELGMRLTNHGCRGRWLKFSLVQIHLNHPSNPDPVQTARNRNRMRKLFFSRRTRVEPGIDTAVERIQEEIDSLKIVSPPRRVAA